MPSLRCSATRTFSSTVRCGKVAEIWNERTIPLRAICAGFSRVMSAPLKRMVPDEGLEEPREQVEDGGLARAVGTDQRVDAAARDPQVHIGDRDEALELLGESAGFENAVGRQAHWWFPPSRNIAPGSPLGRRPGSACACRYGARRRTATHWDD